MGDIKVNQREWQNFILWREEKYGLCDWISTLSGANVLDSLTGKLVAYKTNIPEEYFIPDEIINNSPWKRFITE